MPTRLLDLPAEVVQEIISLVVVIPKDDLTKGSYHNKQIRAQHVNVYTNIRSTCRSFKTFADTREILDAFFPIYFQIGDYGSVILPEDLDKLLSRHPSHFNKKISYVSEMPPMPDMAFIAANPDWRPPKIKIEELPPKVWTEEEKDAYRVHGTKGLDRFRLFADGINTGLMPAMAITELHIESVVPCPYDEWDTPGWKDMLTRLTKLHISFQTLCKPKVPKIRAYPPDTVNKWDASTNNESEDDGIANKRFELAQKQILSWPQYLKNVEHLGLKSEFLGEPRYRGFFSNTQYMTKLVTIELYLMLFGKEFLDFLEARKETLQHLNLQMAGPMRELEDAVEYPPGLDNGDLLFKDVHATLAKLKLIHYFHPVYDTDGAGLFGDEAEGSEALMAQIEENAKEVGYWRADIEHIQNCPGYIFIR